LSDSVLSRVNALLTDPITDSDLSRYRSGERRCRDEKVREAIVEVLGREAGACYDWQTACEAAERQNDALRDRITKMNHNRTFAYSRLTPRMVAMWITFLIILLSLIYFRPALDYVVIERSGQFLNEYHELIDENNELKEELRLERELRGVLTERVIRIEEKTEAMDGEAEP